MRDLDGAGRLLRLRHLVPATVRLVRRLGLLQLIQPVSLRHRLQLCVLRFVVCLHLGARVADCLGVRYRGATVETLDPVRALHPTLIFLAPTAVL